MFLIREALFLLLNTYICLITRGQNRTPTPKVRVCNDYADIAFLVDVSGSIEEDGAEYTDRQVKPFLKSFVRMLNVGPGKIQVGLVTFAKDGYLQFNLKSNVDDIMRGIDNIVYLYVRNDDTNTADGIFVMRTEVLGYNSPNYRPDASHLCIIVTGGYSNVDREYTIPYASDAKIQGIIIFSLGSTPNINVQELVGMASTLPDFDAAVIERAIANNTFSISGAVAYLPTMDLNSFVQQISYYVGQLDCKKVATIVDCKNTADWCTSDYIKPYNCYDVATEKICCRFCRENLIMLGLPTSCRYGDYYPWCEAKLCADHYTECCKTCPTFECNDKADWCSKISSYSCYDLQTELNTCCKTCRTLLTENPLCRYGNAFPWCAPEHCKSTDTATTLGCCTTCPNATCIDNSPSCNSMFPGNCYDGQTERMCCRSCRNKLRADLSCRYDDQYDWCSSKFCWDTPRNCCSTCPKYILW